MRKSFTRFLSLFMLFSVIGLQMVFGAVPQSIPVLLEPSNGKVNVKPAPASNLHFKLMLTFGNELMNGDNFNTSVVKIYEDDGDGTFAVANDQIVDAITVTSTSTRFSISGNAVTLDVQAQLKDSKRYFVEFPAGVVKEKMPDGTNVNNAATDNVLAVPTTWAWSFNTGDYTAPTLIPASAGVFPLLVKDGAANVGSVNSLKSFFKITFNEPIFAGSGSLKIYTKTGNYVHADLPASSLAYSSSTTLAAPYTVDFSTENLRENTDYYILIDANAFKDGNDNNYAGISSTTAWKFKTRDFSAPVFLQNDATSATNTQFKLTFKLNEVGTVHYMVTPAELGALPSTAAIDLAGLNLTVSANTAKETPAAIVATNGATRWIYFYAENAPKYTDLSNTDVLATPLLSQVSKLKVKLNDKVAPSVAGIFPVDESGVSGDVPELLNGSMASPNDKFITITFDEAVQKGASGNITIKTKSDNTVVETIGVSSPLVSIIDSDSNPANGDDQKQVRITLNTKLESSTEYYILVEDGTFTDLPNADGSTNKWAGYQDPINWNFTVRDYKVPTATFSTNLAATNTGGLIANNTAVYVNFSEPVVATDGTFDTFVNTDPVTGTVAVAEIYVEKNNEILDNTKVTYTLAGDKVTITPVGFWDANSTYVFKVRKGSFVDVSPAANQFGDAISKSYTTNSFNLPTVAIADGYATQPLSLVPGALVDPSKTFTVTFSEPITLAGNVEVNATNLSSIITISKVGGSNISYTTTWNSSKREAVLTPVALESSATYTVTVGAGFYNLRKPTQLQATTGDLKYFSVKDKVSPNPALTVNNATSGVNVPTNATLVVDFKEPVNFAGPLALANVDKVVLLRAGSETGPIVPVTWGTVLTANQKFSAVSSLSEGTTYFLSVSAGAVVDNSGNSNVASSISFTTYTLPKVDLTASMPANGGTIAMPSAPGNLVVTLQFDKGVKVDPTLLGSPLAIQVIANTAYQYAAGFSTVAGTTVVATANFTVANVTTSGNTATLVAALSNDGVNPYIWKSSAEYIINVPAGIISDNYNTPWGGISGTSYKFKLADSEKPFVATATYDASKLSNPVVFTFNENVKKGSGIITIERGVAPTIYEYIDVASSAVTITSWNEKEVKLDHAAFDYSTPYKIVWPAGTFTDKTGNPHDGLLSSIATGVTNGGYYSMTTAVDPVPTTTVDSYFPKSGTDNVDKTVNCTITLNENVSIANNTRTISLYSAGGVLVETLAMNSSRITVIDNKITIDWTADFFANTDYWIIIDQIGIVKDSGGNLWPAAGDPVLSSTATTGWYFTTKNMYPPKADFVFAGVYKNPPLAGDPDWTKVSNSGVITINFDKAIRNNDGSAIIPSNIPDYAGHVGMLQLSKISDGIRISFTASISADKKQITIYPSNIIGGLSSLEKYQLVIPAAAIEDVTGSIPTSLNLVGQFKINDYTAPSFNTVPTVTENKKGTEVKFKVQVDEPATFYYLFLSASTSEPSSTTIINTGVAVAMTTDSNDGVGSDKTITAVTTSKSDLKMYYVAADKVIPTISTVASIAVKSADIDAPTVSTYGNNGKVDIATATGRTFKLSFNENVAKNAATRSVYLRRTDNNTLVAFGTTTGGGTITSATSSKDLTFTVGQALDPSTSYYFEVENGFVNDVMYASPVAGATVNAFAGFSGSTYYFFTTTDDVKPVIADVNVYTSGTVVAGKSAVAADKNSQLILTFSEAVKLGTIAYGDFVIYEWNTITSMYEEFEVILLNSSYVSGTKLTLTPSKLFKSGGQYAVKLKKEAITDLTGNVLTSDVVFDPSIPTYNWVFDVKDQAAPVATFSPNGVNPIKAKKSPLTDDVTITFDEAIFNLDGSMIIPDDIYQLVTVTNSKGEAIAFEPVITRTVAPAAVTTVIKLDKLSLKSLETYTVKYGAVFQDAAKNVSDAKELKLTTVNSDAPVIVFEPVNASENVAKDKVITISFSSSLIQEDPTGLVAEGFFSTLENSELKNYLTLTSNGFDVVYTATINSQKNLITIVPAVPFASQATVQLTFDPYGFDGLGGAKADLADNLNNQVKVPASLVKSTVGTNGGLVEFKVIDYTAPLLGTYKPNNAYLYATDNLEVSFNEAVKGGTGYVKIFRKDGTLAQSFDASTLANKSGDNKTIVINPDATLARGNNNEYYVMIDAGAIVDLTGNPFAGTNNNNTAWTYKTVFDVKPIVTLLSPLNDAQNVSVNANLVITFDKKVSIGTGNLAIYKDVTPRGDAFALIALTSSDYRVQMDPTGLKATIDFPTLDGNTNYYVEVESGVFVNALNTSTKFDGIGMASSTVWKFKTEDLAAPKLVTNVPATFPVDDAIDVLYKDPINLWMKFNMKVQKGAGTVRVVKTEINTGTTVETIDIAKATINADSTEVTVPMSVILADGTAYHVFVDGSAIINKLPSKTAFLGVNAFTDWNFTTVKDVAAPTVLVNGYSPSQGAVGLIQKPAFALTFNEPIAVGTGIISIYKASDNSPVVDLTGTVSGSTATFALPALFKLEDNTKYYVKITANAFADKSTAPANNYAGIADATTWSFTTGDNTAPVATYAPIGVNEKADVTLTMTFDEEVVKGAGTLTLYSADNVAVKEFTAAELTVEGKVVTAPKVTGLLDNITYYVKASKGLVKDKAANGPFEFKGIDNATDWTFKVGDNTAPFIADVLPVDKTQKLAKTFNVVITFSEKVSGVDATTLVVTGGVINTVTPDVAGIVYTVNITAPSLADVTLTVPVTVKDMNLNALAKEAVYTYKVDDFSTPTLVGWTPKDGSLEIKADTALIMTFSKPVFAGTVTPTPYVYVYNSLNQLFNKYPVTAANIVDKVVTVPVIGLKDHETYVVTFDGDIVEDYYKVPVVALADPTVWNFTTGDNTAPTVVVDPATATAAKNAFDVTLTFSEDVLNVKENISVTGGTVEVKGTGKSYIASITAKDAAVVVMTIGTGIKDLSLRNHLATVPPFTYTIGDNTAPKLTVTDPAKPIATAFDVKLAFDEAVTGVEAGIVVTNGEATVTGAGKDYNVHVVAAEKAVVGISIPNTIADLSGNKFAGLSEPLVYTVGDFTAPVVTAVSTVLVNDLTVVLTISPDAIVTASDITVTGATSSDITNVENVYTVKAKAKDNAVVVVAVAATVADAAGNKIAGVTSFSNTIGDNTAPELTVTAPKAPIATTFNVGLSFDEVVTGVSMTSIVVTNGTLNSVTGSGKEYVLNITAKEKDVVGISIPTTIADAAGNKFAGKPLEYTIGDFTAPIVTADPSTGVSLKNTFPVVLTFSADAIVTESDIIVTGATKNVITKVDNVFTIDITADDVANVVVSVASTVADAGGNKLAGTSSFIYKVGDNTAPTLDIVGPAAPIETSFIVSLNFSEVVTGFDKSGLTVTNGTIKQFAGSGANYLVSINAAEKAEVKISVAAGAIVDAAGNKFAGKTSTFTVGDFTAPKVVVTPPASPVATVFSIGLKFDEAVTGLILGGTGVSVTNGKIVDITGKNDSYSIVVSALEMTNVKVVLSSDAIADLAGNKFAGQTLEYTIGDFTAPAIVTMTPTLETTLTDNHPIFNMTFSENVKKGAGGNLTVYKVQTTTPVLTIPITDQMITGKNVTVSYTAINGLDKSARYYVLVDGAALTDNAGNAFAGVSDVAAWTFKTGDKFITITDPNSSLEFKVYPNPFVDFVNVGNASQLSKVVVTNIAGQVVKEVVTPSNRIQLNELRSGIYFMSLYNTEDVIVKTAKIVKR